MYKVLVVEDEQLIRKGLIFSFDFSALNACVVAEAENGLEGIEKIKEYQPDIVITDINMPFKNGLDMVKETKEYEYQAIILSGYNEFEYAKRAMNYDVVRYVLKPVDRSELSEALKEAIKRVDISRSLHAKQQEIHHQLISEVGPLSFYAQAMIDMIHEKYREKLQMNDFVVTLKASSSLLNRKFKEEMGLTFHEYLNRYRIQKAIELLKENQMPVYKIAEHTGFSDYKYFSLVFHKYVGCSPKEYRNIIEF